MAADDSALEDAQAIHRFKVGADPMASIGARADALITILDYRKEVIGVPHPVTWIISLPGVIVKADHDIVFLDQFFDGIDGIHGFRGDGAQTDGFGEVKE